MLLGMFLITIVPNAFGKDNENFYWKNSYGRGVGKIPTSHACTNGKEEDAGLCYKPCKAGYHGVGPVCWQNKASYGRGAGTIPGLHGCKKGKEKQTGLCYTPCKADYHGVGPVCWQNGPKSYGRGVGTPLVSICKTGMTADAGLCYNKCDKGYHGVGPVCWGNTPPGYVDCGAGFAKNSTVCATITANQAAVVAFFLGTKVIPPAKQALDAKKMAQLGENGKKTFEAMRPLMAPFKAIFKNVKKSKPGAMISQVKNKWGNLSDVQKFKIETAVKLTTKGSSIGGQLLLSNGQINTINLIRYAADISSVFDPSGLLAVAAAYIYPVYGEDYWSND